MWVIQWATSLSKTNEFGVPIRNFGRVVDNIYRGALPDTAGYRALKDRLGVLRVCSVIEHQTSLDSKRAIDAGMREWRHIPFSDRDGPVSDRVKDWLAYIRTANEEGAIFTHCRGGRHRTGMLVAVYRVTDCGWTKEKAFGEMNRYGWYQALGHKPLKDWFFNKFDPADYRP